MHEQLIDRIRAAFVDGADAAVRVAGAQAARMLLAALDTQPGQPLGAPAAPASAAAAPPAAASAEHPIDRLLGALMEKLGPVLAQVQQQEPQPQQGGGFQVPFVTLPGFGGR